MSAANPTHPGERRNGANIGSNDGAPKPSPAGPGRNGGERKWYRQFWPWFLIAIPLAGVVTASITATYAFTHPDPEVRRAQAVPLDKTSWESRRARTDAQSRTRAE